jgi:hypothetical protein
MSNVSDALQFWERSLVNATNGVMARTLPSKTADDPWLGRSGTTMEGETPFIFVSE